MKYVVVISAVVLFANEDQGGMRVPATKRKVKVKAMETGSRDLAFRVGGEIDNMDLMRTTDRAQFLLELNPRLNESPLAGNNFRLEITGVEDWSAMVMKEQKVSRKKLVLA